MSPTAPPRDSAEVILGVSCDYHDSAAAVLVGGELVSAAEEERFTRLKHDASLPSHAIASCLAIAEMCADDVDVVAFYERPATLLSRYLASRQRQGPAGMWSFAREAPLLVRRNLMVSYRIDRVLRALGAKRSPKFRFVDHHRSHAAAAFFASPFDRAAILTVDGLGEWATASIGRGFGSRIEMFQELRYPDSLGLLYSFVTAFCGFEPNDGEYKLMGLAPYGEPRFLDELASLVDVRPDGSLAVRASRTGWFSRRGLRSRRMARAFDGPARRPVDPIGQREADLAASVQSLTETVMLRLARHAHERTGEGHLCLAGGVALNCVANGRVLREGPFDDLWIQPAAGDSGSAVGAALSVWHETLGHGRPATGRDAMQGAFLGPGVNHHELRAWLARHHIDHEWIGGDGELWDATARRLADGDIVGWFQGRMEFGPRALGHRSILADPRGVDVRRRLNEQVKGREGFRPFAPAVLEDHASSWFDLDGRSPYMLFVAPVAERHRVVIDVEPTFLEDRIGIARSAIPACTHIDGSARVQTVAAESNPELHGLIEAFRRRTGCPILLNTSFNVAGEPIVATPDDAMRSGAAAGLDALVIENAVVERAAMAAWRQP